MSGDEILGAQCLFIKIIIKKRVRNTLGVQMESKSCDASGTRSASSH